MAPQITLEDELFQMLKEEIESEYMAQVQYTTGHYPHRVLSTLPPAGKSMEDIRAWLDERKIKDYYLWGGGCLFGNLDDAVLFGLTWYD